MNCNCRLASKSPARQGHAFSYQVEVVQVHDGNDGK